MPIIRPELGSSYRQLTDYSRRVKRTFTFLEFTQQVSNSIKVAITKLVLPFQPSPPPNTSIITDVLDTVFIATHQQYADHPWKS